MFIKWITLHLSHDNLPLMKYVLPVTVHLNLLFVIKKFLQMSHLLQLTIVPLLLILGLEYKEGATISLRFFFRFINNRKLIIWKGFF